MSSAHIELPYDRGHQWHLVVGEKRAVISERAALVLAVKLEVPIKDEPTLPGKCIRFVEEVGNDYRLSKKARAMLEFVGVKAGGS